MIKWLKSLFKVQRNKEDWEGEVIDRVPTKWGEHGDWTKLIDFLKLPDMQFLKKSTDFATLKKVSSYLDNHIWYQADKGDLWQKASMTIQAKTGDCDCIAILFSAICRQLGIFTRVALGHKNGGAHAFNLWYNEKGECFLIDVKANWCDYANRFDEYTISHSFSDKFIWEHAKAV